MTSSRREMVDLYFQYCSRSESLGLSRPWSMQEWYERARRFNGEGSFEHWFWNTSETLPPLVSPNFLRYEDIPELNEFPCFYHDCPKQMDPYNTRQNRNNHFDSIHLGIRSPPQSR